MDDYPELLLRGIVNNSPEFITPEGYPTQGVFKFDSYDGDSRDDGFCELSVNWVDNEDAIHTLLNQINVKKGTIQFQGGYCKLNRLLIKQVLKDYIDNNHLSYERHPIKAAPENGNQNNPFHGNLLIKNDISKQAKTNIQTTLAGIAGMVIKRTEE